MVNKINKINIFIYQFIKERVHMDLETLNDFNYIKNNKKDGSSILAENALKKVIIGYLNRIKQSDISTKKLIEKVINFFLKKFK